MLYCIYKVKQTTTIIYTRELSLCVREKWYVLHCTVPTIVSAFNKVISKKLNLKKKCIESLYSIKR